MASRLAKRSLASQPGVIFQVLSVLNLMEFSAAVVRSIATFVMRDQRAIFLATYNPE
jgi:hypothetical protein